uniref:A_deaminase domain-containing protein n=1 Tax=Caenorhabditis tropicalis TaxID=1561998 RepID=A0A1I7TV68_9PELO
MPPKRHGKQNKKSNIAEERKRQAQEATRKAERDKEDHSYLDAQIADREKKEEAARQELADKMAVTLHVQQNFLPKFKNMPKVELHAHLSGSLSRNTIETIMVSDMPRAQDILAKYQLSSPSDMNHLFDLFPIVNAILEKPEMLKAATFNTIREFMEDGCVYLELRTGPKNTPWMTKETYLRTVIEAVKEARIAFPQIKVFLIVSFNRTLTAEAGAELLAIIGVLQLESDVIIGVELSGDPSVSGSHLLQLFQFARRFHGLGVTIHLAEVMNQMTDVLDYLMMLPDRIGHGTFLHKNPKFVEMMTFYRIPLEICLTSNIYSKTTTNMYDSHFNFWRKLGVPVAICTDDKGMLPGASLTEEYYKAAVAFNLTSADIIQINADALKASFAYKYKATDLTDTWRKIQNNTLE